MIGKLGLLSCSLVFICVVGEVLTRWSGYAPRRGSRVGNVVHHQTSEFKHDVVLNSLDLREAESGPKTNGEYRILVLGDSFTYGLGVEEDETYVRLTESLLTAQARRE